jgi:hypothetical protein
MTLGWPTCCARCESSTTLAQQQARCVLWPAGDTSRVLGMPHAADMPASPLSQFCSPFLWCIMAVATRLQWKTMKLSALKEDVAAQHILLPLYLFVRQVSTLVCMQLLTTSACCFCDPSVFQVYGDNCWCYTDTSPGVFTGQTPRAKASNGSSSSQSEQPQHVAAAAPSAAGGQLPRAMLRHSGPSSTLS